MAEIWSDFAKRGEYDFPSAPTPITSIGSVPDAPQRSETRSNSEDRTPCGCEAGDYRPECWPDSNNNCGAGTHPGEPPPRAPEGRCPDGGLPDATGNCNRLGPTPIASLGNCPPGQTWVGRHNKCLPDCQGAQTRDAQGNCVGSTSYGGGGGAAPSGGGGGGGAARPSAPAAYSPQASEFNALLEKMIREGLTSPSRYTPEALQAIYGQITKQTSGRILRGERAVRANAAQRGISRAGSVQAALRGVRDSAESDRGSAIVQVQMAKINADYADKNAALDRAQRYLDSLRDSEYRMLLASEQRRQYDSNLALSYATLAQQRTLLEMTLQSDWDRLRAAFGYSVLAGGI